MKSNIVFIIVCLILMLIVLLNTYEDEKRHATMNEFNAFMKAGDRNTAVDGRLRDARLDELSTRLSIIERRCADRLDRERKK